MRRCHQFISTVACFVIALAVEFAQGKPSPKDGFVPDADTAIKIAVVVWSRIYGERDIAAQKPYRATLTEDGIWIVQGSPRAVSVAYAYIAKADGRILLIGMANKESNQSMKPTAPPRNTLTVIATTPCRGLSLSR
jgi:hypothetical protein